MLAGEAGLQIVAGLATIREAQKFLGKYFARTRLIGAPFLSAAAGRNVYLKLETELPNTRHLINAAQGRHTYLKG
jgi:threonine dehydratase